MYPIKDAVELALETNRQEVTGSWSIEITIMTHAKFLTSAGQITGATKISNYHMKVTDFNKFKYDRRVSLA